MFSFESCGYCCYCCCWVRSQLQWKLHFAVVKVTIFPGSLIMFLHLFSRHVYFTSSIFSSVCCWAAVPPQLVQQPNSCFLAPPSSCFFHAKLFLQAVWAHSEGRVGPVSLRSLIRRSSVSNESERMGCCHKVGAQRPFRAPYARLPVQPDGVSASLQFTRTRKPSMKGWICFSVVCFTAVTCDWCGSPRSVHICAFPGQRFLGACFSLLSCLLVSICCFGIKLVLVNLRKYVSSLTARALERTEEICSGVRPLTAGSSLLGNTVSHQRGVLFAPGMPLCHNHLQVGGTCYRQIDRITQHEKHLPVLHPVCRVYKSVIQAVQKSDEGHPFR